MQKKTEIVERVYRYFKNKIKKIMFFYNICSQLTVMTGGSRVSCSWTVTEERVPGLRTFSIMLTVVRKTSAVQK